ncbi:MAG: NAD(+) synthase [Firmicutes bacterium]|nr:NAD(+) synthase [Bacillota bacterium]MBQ9605106.1 NAD(+) synthase [Bacillota bacterium]
MDYGYIRTAAATPKVKVGCCSYNKEQILKTVNEAYANGAELLVLPELCITGYTCGDLFGQTALIDEARRTLAKIAAETKNINMVFVVGLPFEHNNKLYNCAAVVCGGKVRGIVPKTFLPNYNEFYEMRWFSPAPEEQGIVFMEPDNIIDYAVFGRDIVFYNSENENFTFSVELCEDLWAPEPPSIKHALAGANIILNLSAGNEITGKAEYRRDLVAGQSGRLICGYIYACAGDGESTTDVVFSGHDIIAENGTVLAESTLFKNGIVYADMDLMSIASHRRKNTSFRPNTPAKYHRVDFSVTSAKNTDLRRFIDPHPFVPSDESKRDYRCKLIMDIQAAGLKKRIEHIGTEHVVLGISGGLDSTLALLITARAFEQLGRDKKGIITVTMPCFGTTNRTHDNAVKMCEALGTTFKEVDIKAAVMKHFEDIEQDGNNHDLTYENSQARERTQVLMDIAGKYNGFVVGTGDLSELALGWATYNGDHMSMYGVNGSIPKTLIKYLVKYAADTTDKPLLKEALYDVLDTPVSPELLPPDKDGNITQITEDKVGPYELHDFFLYNMMRLSFPAEKILFLAEKAFEGVYDKETILKWLKNFYWRFFSQQFKRSCLPDGPKVGSVSLSPRGDWRMPSDAVPKDWLKGLE